MVISIWTKTTVIFFTILFQLPGLAWALDLSELIRKVEQQYTGQSSISKVEMTVVTGHWERHLSMESWSLGREHFLVRILSPAKEKGVSTLKVEREVWNFLPKVDRVIRIPPSMMGGAWMGSHITNDDLVKANHIDQDYDFSLLDEDEQQWTIMGIPKPEAPVIWGKIVYQILKDQLVPLQIEYYDEEDVLVRRILFDDVQTIGDRTVPLKMTVLPLEKPQEKTIMHYRDLRFDVDLNKAFFSLGQLKRRR
ncbi:MAG: outer membrane lipoprotein-sorting protein [Deltaproteobacteria bacterium]|nr:outer membrane lipoprotein-sorting protein [Deltaproteobacteria bacterium]MCW9049437.1 outer membrane lipoprotein-sorting protein [Deltaproteobacteria bacterium]